MEELWKTIPIEGCEHYQISNYGRARLLPREVPTHIVNRGRDMTVIAKRKGKDIKPSYDGGRPCLRLRMEDGTRLKRSLPMLVLLAFGPPCPGDLEQYTAKYIDNDVTNNHIDNLVWISRAALASIVGKLTIGEEKPHFQKYHNIVISFHDHIIAYYRNTTEAIRELNQQGFNTSETVLTRALKDHGGKWYHIFTVFEVDDKTFEEISLKHSIYNVKLIYDVIMLDRQLCRKYGPAKDVAENVIMQSKPKKEVEVKLEVKPSPSKPKVKPKPVEQKPTEVKPKVSKPVEVKQKTELKKPVKTRVDDLTDDDFIKDMEKQKAERERIARENFKKELLRRMQNGQ